MDDVVTHSVSCPAMTTAPLEDILHQLDHLQATLDAIRRSVQQLQLVDRPIQPRPTANGHSRG